MKKNKIFFVVFVVAVVFANCVFAQNATSLYESGLSAKDDGDWYAASQFFIEATKANPSYGDAWYELAETTYFLGQYDLVLSYLDTAERYKRGSSIIQNLRGLTFIALGRTNEARSVFNSVLSRSPNDVDARFGLAELDLLDGKVSGAEQLYMEALSRQGTNRKALLSLALVSSELGKFEQAESYMNRALRYYSGETEVHYLAAWLAVMRKDFVEAERQCRAAIELNSRYDNAYALLASVLYTQQKYLDVINVCNFRIGVNRSRSDAWYLQGMAQHKLGDISEAIASWVMGLSIDPSDEIMRAMLELTVNENLPLEDGRRSDWAAYHISVAREYARRYDASSQNYEYQRALKIDPLNAVARSAYADMLQLNGFHELYLEQMRFMNEVDASGASVKRDDIIEGYSSLLENSLAHRWNVETFYLDKVRWKIGIYNMTVPLQFVHADANEITAKMAADIFSGAAVTSVSAQQKPVSGFGEAYRNARADGMDYFVIMSVEEGARDITLNATIYSARTGTEVSKSSFYAGGINRYSNVLRRFRENILSHLAVRGKILDRNGSEVIVDLGRSENIVDGAKFDVVRRGAIYVADDGNGVSYRTDDVLGTITITETSEEISLGRLSLAGFYDRVNTGDEIVLLSLPEPQEKDETLATDIAGNTPQTTASGEDVAAERENIITASDLRRQQVPIYVDLIRGIR